MRRLGRCNASASKRCVQLPKAGAVALAASTRERLLLRLVGYPCVTCGAVWKRTLHVVYVVWRCDDAVAAWHLGFGQITAEVDFNVQPVSSARVPIALVSEIDAAPLQRTVTGAVIPLYDNDDDDYVSSAGAPEVSRRSSVATGRSFNDFTTFGSSRTSPDSPSLQLTFPSTFSPVVSPGDVGDGLFSFADPSRPSTPLADGYGRVVVAVYCL